MRAVQEHLLGEDASIEEVEEQGDALLVHTTELSWRVAAIRGPSSDGLRFLEVRPDLWSDPPMRPEVFALFDGGLVHLGAPDGLAELCRRLHGEPAVVAAAAVAMSAEYRPGATIEGLSMTGDCRAGLVMFHLCQPGRPIERWTVEVGESQGVHVSPDRDAGLDEAGG